MPGEADHAKNGGKCSKFDLLIESHHAFRWGKCQPNEKRTGVELDDMISIELE